MTLSFREHAPHIVKMAYLSWGYLALFAEFGYAYVLCPAARVVREALINARDARLGRGYWIRWGDDLSVRPLEVTAILEWSTNLLGTSPTFLSLGVRLGHVAVLMPCAADSSGEVYRRAGELLEGTETDRLLPVPFWEWFGKPRRGYLDTRCDLWLRDPAEVRAIVHTTPDLAVASLQQAHPPTFQAKAGHRATINPPAIPALPTDLDAATWPAFAARALAEWWSRSPGATGRSLVLPSDGMSLLRVAVQIAPAYLVAHLRDIERIFGPGAAEDEGSQSPTSAIEVLLDWGETNSVSVTDVTVTDEMIDAERKIGQTWLWSRLDGRPLLIGPFYSARTFLTAVRPCLNDWLVRHAARGKPRAV